MIRLAQVSVSFYSRNYAENSAVRLRFPLKPSKILMKGSGRMKSYRKELWLNLPTRRGFVNITPEVEVALRESGIKEGFVLVNTSHYQLLLCPAV